MAITTAYQSFVQALEGHYGRGEAESIARIVFEDVFGIRNVRRADEMTAVQMDRLKSIQMRLEQLEPVQYVLGEADFYGLKLKVSPAVLIPRQETEELVHWILGAHPKEPPLRLLDIGTGSGCIPLALQKNRPQWKVAALDVSEDALVIAQVNAAKYALPIELFHTDILSESTWEDLGQWDILVSNPPYIPRKEAHLMAAHVLEQEPHLALFVENDDPLLFYRTIAAFAKKQLTSKGWLYFEVNSFNAGDVVQLLEKEGFEEVKLHKDINGNNRMVRARKP